MIERPSNSIPHMTNVGLMVPLKDQLAESSSRERRRCGHFGCGTFLRYTREGDFCSVHEAEHVAHIDHDDKTMMPTSEAMWIVQYALKAFETLAKASRASGIHQKTLSHILNCYSANTREAPMRELQRVSKLHIRNVIWARIVASEAGHEARLTA